MDDFTEKAVDGFLSPSGDVISEETLASGAVEFADYNWVLVGFGIFLAGGAYPVLVYALWVVLAAIVLVFQWLFVGGSQLSESVDTFTTLLSSVAYACLPVTFGAFWAGFVSFIVLPLYFVFIRSLQVRASILLLGAGGGGLVGFVAVLPLASEFLRLLGSGETATILLVIAAGPCLTTVLGQVGGAWGGRLAFRELVGQLAPGQLEVLGGQLRADGKRQPRLRFQVRHVLWIIFWLALLLTVLRFTDLPFEFVLPLMMAWLFFQAVTLCLCWKLFTRWWPRWRAWRARRST